MAGEVQFKDFSVEIMGVLDETTKQWLIETANEVASQAGRNTSKDGWSSAERTQLRESYKANIDNVDKGTVVVGTPLEQGYWEEFGTGEYADTAKNGGKRGRQGWWIYTPGSKNPSGEKSRTYDSKEEAEDMVDYILKKHGKQAVATNGRRPNYTLEKAFSTSKNGAIDNLKKRLKERMEK